MGTAEYSRRYQEAQKAKGLCIACGCKRPHVPGRTLCQPCLDYMNNKAKERCAARKAAGLCRQCGKRPTYSEVFCLVCLEHQREHNRKPGYKPRKHGLPNKALKLLREHQRQQVDIEFTDALAEKQELGRLLLDEVMVPGKKPRGRPAPLRKLDDRERAMISLYYGLDGGKPRVLEEIGQAFGVTRERVRQLIKPFDVVAKQIGLPKAQNVPHRLRKE